MGAARLPWESKKVKFKVKTGGEVGTSDLFFTANLWSRTEVVGELCAPSLKGSLKFEMQNIQKSIMMISTCLDSEAI